MAIDRTELLLMKKDWQSKEQNSYIFVTHHNIAWKSRHIMTFCHKNIILCRENAQWRHLCRKRAITTFLPQKFMITRSLIAFEDLLASSIAPQVMPTWLSALWISLVILRRNKDLQKWWNWGPFCRWRTRPFSECPLSRQIFSRDRFRTFLWLRCA